MAPRRARVLGSQGDHPQALRRHLIAVTQRLLASHGLTGLTTRSIAREAQVADGVLYNHFADKDDLVVTALAEQLDDLGTRFAARCPRPGEQDLAAGLGTLVQECSRFGAEAFPLVAGLVGRPDLLHRLFVRLHGTDQVGQPIVWRDVVAYLAGEQARGTIAQDVPVDALASMVVGATQLAALRTPWGAPAPGPDPASDPDPDRHSDPDGAGPPVARPGIESAALVALLVRACRAEPPAGSRA